MANKYEIEALATPCTIDGSEGYRIKLFICPVDNSLSQKIKLIVALCNNDGEFKTPLRFQNGGFSSLSIIGQKNICKYHWQDSVIIRNDENEGKDGMSDYHRFIKAPYIMVCIQNDETLEKHLVQVKIH